MSVPPPLVAGGYPHWISVEWEKHWHPEIETPEIAAMQAGAIAALPGARLVAITDTDAGSAAAFAAARGGTAEPDLDALLARTDVDVVCVCVPSGLHAEVGVRAAQAGKHLVVEKPIEVTLAAADRLIEAARTAGVALTVISQHRFDPGLIDTQRLLSAGALGSLVLYVDLLRWCMGPVAEVTAVCTTQAHQIEVEDTALAILRFTSGAVGTVLSSTAAFPGFPQRLEITGTSGTVIIEDGQIVRRAFGDHVQPEPAQPEPAQSEPARTGAAADPAALDVLGHAAQLGDLLAAIGEGREPAVGGQAGRDALEIVCAIYESSRSGRPVTLSS